MMKFKKGETVVEPSIGICNVIGMKMMKVDGQDMTMYIFEAQNANVYVPADQLEKRGIRRPMTREDVKRVLASLKQPASPNRADARLQYVNYREIMKSGDPAKITRLLRDLYILDQSDDLKGKEKEIMDQAKKFLCDEIAFVRETSKTQVMETINEALRQMYKKKMTKDKEKAKKSGVGLSMGILGYEDDEAAGGEEEKEVLTGKAAKTADDGETFDEDDSDEDEDGEEKAKPFTEEEEAFFEDEEEDE
ncbi:MAG: CarD family transcriptional regulator [Candidatus Sumerlaeota bacterium]|nr:CarD family transcriptional regulator [Candidatus Sumerlaeota bacterium]